MSRILVELNHELNCIGDNQGYFLIVFFPNISTDPSSKAFYILKLFYIIYSKGFPSDSAVKNLPAMQEIRVLIPRSGRTSADGNGNPLQYVCLGNPMDRAWWAAVHEVTKELDMP